MQIIDQKLARFEGNLNLFLRMHTQSKHREKELLVPYQTDQSRRDPGAHRAHLNQRADERQRSKAPGHTSR